MYIVCLNKFTILFYEFLFTLFFYLTFILPDSGLKQ